MIPNSTNQFQGQHCLPVNFNNSIFNSTISSQYQLHQLLNFNMVISLKINSRNQLKKFFFCCWINSCSYLIFNNLKSVKINDSKFMSTTQNFVSTNWIRAGPFLPRESGEIYKMADGSDREVTQADQNDINSQWTVYFLQI